MNGPEQLCTWYLRLNGYLTISNFYAHDRKATLGEIDVIGVRFPNSQELHFKDSSALMIPVGKTDVVLVESEKGNIGADENPWKSRTKEALEYAIRRVGIVPPEDLDKACEAIKNTGHFSGKDFCVRALCCGHSVSADIEKLGIACLKWAEILKFIQSRFHENEKLKAQHEQWGCFGRYLWKQLNDCSVAPDESSFFCEWEKLVGGCPLSR